MIKLLIVEDSRVIQDFLCFIFRSDPEIQIVGIAEDGLEAIEKIKLLRPDVVTMDINMPKMNGIYATKEIMSSYPLPIIVVSGSRSSKESVNSFESIEAGALAVLQRPAGIGHPDFDSTSRELIKTVKAMSEVKVVRRWHNKNKLQSKTHNEIFKPDVKSGLVRIIAIGASTGGPSVIQNILSHLPINFRFPILIVQHMSNGFIPGFVDWLNKSSMIPVHEPVHEESILPGHVYIAPDDFQMGVNSSGKIILTTDNLVNGHKPSISYLFQSIADNYGQNAIGILLTGMGKDGANELKILKDKSVVTIAQDEESSVVFGIPGEAVRINAAAYVLPPDKIISLLSEINV
ncbi:MAG: chemotaxis-specific protein-glutamate methyltransferase CheB [Bacteroidetes bacterium]|nr:chemotaxis-specific protein-glutamate methyltransferase CheB [Bacteroidota bacterium]